jgi:hypothetical protein
MLIKKDIDSNDICQVPSVLNVNNKDLQEVIPCELAHVSGFRKSILPPIFCSPQISLHIIVIVTLCYLLSLLLPLTSFPVAS